MKSLFFFCFDASIYANEPLLSNIRQLTFTSMGFEKAGEAYFSQDGLNQRQLTNNCALNWAAYWHPNGRWIAYTTSIHGHHAYEIYIMDIETKKECRVTDNSNFDGLPSFSLDEKKMLWTSKRNENTCHVYMADFIEENFEKELRNE